MNHFHSRLRIRRHIHLRAGLAAVGVAAATLISGCGTGQISQTANQASAVNGTEGYIGDLSLHDVRVQATQTGDYLRPGRVVDLIFVVSNQSTDTDDELTAITTGIGHVSVSGDRKLPATGVLVVGEPVGQDAASLSVVNELRGVEDADAAEATVTLDKPVTNGLTYDFTFNFKKAGQISLAVPISAGVETQSASVKPSP